MTKVAKSHKNLWLVMTFAIWVIKSHKNLWLFGTYIQTMVRVGPWPIVSTMSGKPTGRTGENSFLPSRFFKTNFVYEKKSWMTIHEFFIQMFIYKFFIWYDDMKKNREWPFTIFSYKFSYKIGNDHHRLFYMILWMI